jgi:hypothetical protein
MGACLPTDDPPRAASRGLAPVGASESAAAPCHVAASEFVAPHDGSRSQLQAGCKGIRPRSCAFRLWGTAQRHEISPLIHAPLHSMPCPAPLAEPFGALRPELRVRLRCSIGRASELLQGAGSRSPRLRDMHAVGRLCVCAWGWGCDQQWGCGVRTAAKDEVGGGVLWPVMVLVLLVWGSTTQGEGLLLEWAWRAAVGRQAGRPCSCTVQSCDAGAE